MAPVYWTLKSVPELSDLTRAARGRLWRRYTWKRFRYWQNWIAILIAVACAVGGVWIGEALAESSGAIIGGGVGGGIGGLLYGQITIPLIRPYLRAARDSDPEVSSSGV